MNHGKSPKNSHLRMSVRIHSPIILPWPIWVALAYSPYSVGFSLGSWLYPGLKKQILQMNWTLCQEGVTTSLWADLPSFTWGLWLRSENQLSTERMQSDKDRLHPCEILVNLNYTLGPIASLLDSFYGVTSFMSPLSTFKWLPFDICPVTV